MIKTEWRKVLDKIAVELGHFVLILITLVVGITYIVHSEEAALMLEPTMPLLLAAGFLAIGLIIGGREIK